MLLSMLNGLKDVEGEMIALPLEERFWNDLFDATKEWGMINYQQVWSEAPSE